MNKGFDKISIILWILISITFVAFAQILVLFIQVFFKEINFVNASHFGSFLGGITSLIAIILLYKTYQSQKTELQLARDIATKQEKTMREQKIENSVFNMLSALRETINLIDGSILKPSPMGGKHYIQYQGRAYLRESMKELINELKTKHSNLKFNPKKGNLVEEVLTIERVENRANSNTQELIPRVIGIIEHDIEVLKKDLIANYELFYNEHHSSLSHYFRYVYNIIKFILESGLRKEEEKKYLSLLQAQLSSDEMGLIFYNSLSKYGKENIANFIIFFWLDNYQILEDVNPNSLCEQWHHLFYPKTQFKFLNSQEREEKQAYNKMK
jgi:hypothetical protein